MKIFSTLLSLEDDMTGTIYLMDTIQHEGRFWLVPQWLEAPSQGWRKPARIICLDLLPHQTMSSHKADFLLNQPLPRCAYDGTVPTQLEKQLVVIIAPEIQVPLPPRAMN